jgi:hypothetical protein
MRRNPFKGKFNDDIRTLTISSGLTFRTYFSFDMGIEGDPPWLPRSSPIRTDFRFLVRQLRHHFLLRRLQGRLHRVGS